ncbi:Acetyl-coenzyme A synthetase [Pseudoruegeria aquimaris]|uniref:Acetyl-coenzyme A synthetase n=1 Tax=Pseudoruegeria aquimaris TaxID=393663 RepID=A0A1Y5RXP4_9RHOB|nr:AMP-binding protein [Pseudoruegeria aquimaris]SLN27378.1 Acetyl-coenzyme A synthetase [Pseudoruegeria aquimaris]
MSTAAEPWRLIDPSWDWSEAQARFRWQVPAHFNIAEACCDRWARMEPEKLALTHVTEAGARERWTYGALKAASDRLASALAADGISSGDRVAVLLPQGPEVLITHFAAMKLGAIVLPLFTLFGRDALEYRLADSGAKILVTDPANLEKATALDAPLSAIYCTGPEKAAAPVRSFSEAITRAQPLRAPVNTRSDDPAVLIYTSGTTGPPKGALHAHRFLLGHLPCMEIGHMHFPQPGAVGWTPADWAWIGGLMDMAMPCLYYGVPQVSGRMRKFDPDAAFRLIRDESLTTLFLPPTALRLMRQASVPPGLRVRSVSSGGESLGADLLEWGRAKLSAPINELYGQTECNLVVSANPEMMRIKPGTMGRALPGHEVAIIDAEGRPLPAGQEGEIAVKAPDPVMFLGYWNQPEATARKFVDGWLKTGDLGRMDDEGYITYGSRDDDVITSAGYRIGPTEIENCLAGHPDVLAAAVVGVPDPIRTEAVKAYVVLREGAEWAGLEAELIARVRRQVSAHVAPRSVERIAEMPMTATGKIMRRDLRARG